VDVKNLPEHECREKFCCEIAGRKLRNPSCGSLFVDSSEVETAGSIPVWGVELCPHFSLLFSADLPPKFNRIFKRFNKTKSSKTERVGEE
jgi:hypothetical protein